MLIHNGIDSVKCLAMKLAHWLLPFLVSFCIGVSPVQAEQRWLLPEGFPAQVEHGLELLRQPALQGAMQAFNAIAQNGDESKDSTVLVILHGRSDADRALAARLRDWLLMLGMRTEQIRLDKTRKLENQLRIEVKP